MPHDVLKVFLLISDVCNISGKQSGIIHFKDEETEFKSIKQTNYITHKMPGTVLGVIVTNLMVDIA